MITEKEFLKLVKLNYSGNIVKHPPVFIRIDTGIYKGSIGKFRYAYDFNVFSSGFNRVSISFDQPTRKVKTSKLQDLTIVKDFDGVPSYKKIIKSKKNVPLSKDAIGREIKIDDVILVPRGNPMGGGYLMALAKVEGIDPQNGKPVVKLIETSNPRKKNYNNYTNHAFVLRNPEKAFICNDNMKKDLMMIKLGNI